MDTLTLSRDAYNAHLLGGVIEATAPPHETPGAKQTRAAVIVEMFRAFESANAMESMIACHCVTLQFLLAAAMRDACDITLDPVILTRMRASAMSISKTLHLWMAKYEKLQTRNEIRAAEAATHAEHAPAAAPSPAPVKPPAAPLKPAIPNTPGAAPSGHPGPAIAAHPAPVTPAGKEALLASTAIFHGASPNGRLTVPAPIRGEPSAT